MSDHEWMLLIMLLLLVATFLVVYFNPIENPLAEKKPEHNPFVWKNNTECNKWTSTL